MVQHHTKTNEVKMKKAALIALTLTVFSTAYAQTANPQDVSSWTSNDHWENTQLNFQEMVYGTVTKSTCTQSVKQFLGCMAVINKAYSLKHPGKKVLVKYKRSKSSDFEVTFHDDLAPKEFHDLKKDYFQTLASELDSNAKSLNLYTFNADPVLKDISESIINETNDSMLASALYNEYLSLAYDPHTYITPLTVVMERQKPVARRKGIGIYYNKYDLEGKEVFILTDVIPNSPANKAGLEEGDIILKANKADTTKTISDVMSNEDLITFELLRDDKVVIIELERDFYQVSVVESSVVERDEQKYGYIKLRNFTTKTGCKKIREAGLKMLNEGVEGLILDLRNNGGGLVTEAQCIMSLYLEQGSTIWGNRYVDKDENIIVTDTSKEKPVFDNIHTVTLINGYSASASEATAMYLQDYRKSFVVGERSYGKGSMQALVQMQGNDKVIFAKTTALYYGPKGISPQIQGVSPDIVSYPKIDQTEPTKFVREADGYMFVLENKNDEDLTQPEREADKLLVKSCLTEKDEVRSRYDLATSSEKRVFDNQLETAIEVIDCANEYVEIYSEIDIPKTTKYEMMDRFEWFFRSFKGEMKPIGIKMLPETIKPKLELQPMKPVQVNPEQKKRRLRDKIKKLLKRD
jgi:carboxyl-terminal processing protease